VSETSQSCQRDALVLVWSRDEPARIGELTWIPDEGASWWLGRQADEAEARLGFVRQRPAGDRPTGPLTSRHLSRRQLRFVRRGIGLQVERHGRQELRINGVRRTRGLVTEGDVIEVSGELVLLYERRGPLAHCADHTFGGPDTGGLVGESAPAWALRSACADVGDRHALLVSRRGGPVREAVQLVATGRPIEWVDAGAFAPSELRWRLLGREGDSDAVGALQQACGGVLALFDVHNVADAVLLELLDTAVDTVVVGVTGRERVLAPSVARRFARHVEVPTLGERRSDVALLARQWLRDHARRFDAAQGAAPERLHPRLLVELLTGQLPRSDEAFIDLLFALLDGHDGGRYLQGLTPGR